MKFGPESDRPPHQQLREQIISRIRTGEMRIGDVVPSVRTVSCQLGIAVNTVSSVYRELVVEGWLAKRPSSQHVVKGIPLS